MLVRGASPTTCCVMLEKKSVLTRHGVGTAFVAICAALA